MDPAAPVGGRLAQPELRSSSRRHPGDPGNRFLLRRCRRRLRTPAATRARAARGLPRALCAHRALGVRALARHLATDRAAPPGTSSGLGSDHRRGRTHVPPADVALRGDRAALRTDRTAHRAPADGRDQRIERRRHLDRRRGRRAARPPGRRRRDRADPARARLRPDGDGARPRGDRCRTAGRGLACLPACVREPQVPLHRTDDRRRRSLAPRRLGGPDSDCGLAGRPLGAHRPRDRARGSLRIRGVAAERTASFGASG